MARQAVNTIASVATVSSWLGAIDARPPKTRPRTEICGHPPSWTREPRQTPQNAAGLTGPHHHPTGHANQNNPTAKTHHGIGALPAGGAAPPSATTGTGARRAMSDTRESAVMTSTETDSGHTIQRWGHRLDRPDPDATMTAEAIEQRPGVPSTDAPTHPNREPAPLGTTRSTNLRAGSPDRRAHRAAAPLVTTRKTGGRPPGCTHSVRARCAQRNQRKRQRPETPTERDCPAIHPRHRQPPRPDQLLAPVVE